MSRPEDWTGWNGTNVALISVISWPIRITQCSYISSPTTSPGMGEWRPASASHKVWLLDTRVPGPASWCSESSYMYMCGRFQGSETWLSLQVTVRLTARAQAGGDRAS